MSSSKCIRFLMLISSTGIVAQAQSRDSGIRVGAPAVGKPIDGLTAGELDFFTNHGVPQFTQVEAVADGLGPRFNLDSCGGCHAFPALGGLEPRDE